MITAVELKKAEMQLGDLKHKAPVVVSRSLNRAVANINTNLSRHARKIYYLKAKTIRSTMTVKKATTRDLRAMTTSKGQRTPLKYFEVIPGEYDYHHPEDAIPMEVAVRKKSGTHKLKHAFISPKMNDHIFERKTKKRFPLRKLTSLAVPQAFKDKNLRKTVRETAMEIYKKRFDHEIKRLLEAS